MALNTLSARSFVMHSVNLMKPGQRVRFSPDVFDGAFPTHPLFDERPPMDQFLESMVSANYGAWTARYDLMDHYYEIARHEPCDKIIRRDFDRRASESRT